LKDYPFLRVEVGSNYSSNPPAPAAPPADNRGDWEKVTFSLTS